MNIFYINLDRRQDRKEKCEKQFKDQNLEFIRYPGIDGKSYKFNSKELQMFKNADFMNYTNYLQCMGNFLSHWNIWYKIIEKNLDYAIVFQDDIAIIPNFKEEIQKIILNLPEDTEFIFIAQQYNNSSLQSYDIVNQNKNINFNYFFKKSVNEYVGYLKNHINPCSLGYIITRKGAMNIIRHTKKQGVIRATDGHLNDYLTNKNIFYGSILVLGTSNPIFGSDIFS
jgi:GR25 family glycosyltransferase involved in LPS biosynthesis